MAIVKHCHAYLCLSLSVDWY